MSQTATPTTGVEARGAPTAHARADLLRRAGTMQAGALFAPRTLPPSLTHQRPQTAAAKFAESVAGTPAAEGWTDEPPTEARRSPLVLLLPIALAMLVLLLATRITELLELDVILGVYAVMTIASTVTYLFIATACYRDPSRRPTRRIKEPLVSCLVAVKDEVDLIEQCIASMLNSSYVNIEVIAIDDGSTDGTTERLREMRDRYPALEVVFLPESRGKKRALTLGSRLSKGEILLFTDSDCILAQDAVERTVAAFQADPYLGALSGDARALNADESLLARVQDVWYDGQFAVIKAAESVFGAVTCISGPLAAFRREAIYNYLPAWANDRFLGQEFRFATDRQLTAYVLASRQVGYRLQMRHADSPHVAEQYHAPRHWKVRYVKSARVWTRVPARMRPFIRQQVRWKKSFLRNLCFLGPRYWRCGPVPAFLFYSHLLFVLAMPFMLLRHLVWLPTSGAWILAAAYFAGLLFKGATWGLAFKVDNPKSPHWIYRPIMSVLNAFLISPLLLYAALTIRSNVWKRG